MSIMCYKYALDVYLIGHESLSNHIAPRFSVISFSLPLVQEQDL